MGSTKVYFSVRAGAGSSSFSCLHLSCLQILRPRAAPDCQGADRQQKGEVVQEHVASGLEDIPKLLLTHLQYNIMVTHLLVIVIW